MARFYPVIARRSDGKLDILGKARKRETNEPTAEQLDQKPDKNGVADYYREVSLDEPKHLDWRRKLGGMLAHELGWKPKDGLPGETQPQAIVFTQPVDVLTAKYTQMPAICWWHSLRTIAFMSM